MALAERIIEALSESGQTSKGLSIGRVLTVVLVTAVVAWDSSYVVYAMKFNWMLAQLKALTPGILPIPVLPDVATLAGQGVFMTLFYGVNKLTGAYTDSKLGAPPEK